MRFGKRTRTLASAGRRLLGNRREIGDEAVVAEERNALLGSRAEEEVMPAPPDHETPMTGDPTQHLLTALGRFQRQVAKAENGAPQDSWSDECMGQLIAGIEVAYEQGWPDVQEAMTDAARVLQSYEDAGQASSAVPFLQDSYEILCLMVGDLIVDNVRSGVIEKWRQRYRRALDELAKLGIPLVEDEDSVPVERPEPVRAPRPVAAYVAEEAPEWESIGLEEEPIRASEPVFSTPETRDWAQDTPFDATPEEEPEEAQGVDLVFSDEPMTEETAPFEMPPDLDTAMPDAGGLPSLDDLLISETDRERPSLTQGDLSIPEKEEDLMTWVEKAMEAPEEADPAPAAHEDLAISDEEEPEEVMAPVAELAAPVEEAPLPDSSQTPVVVSAPAAPSGPGSDLLQTTQAAIARGDVADAKAMALQLAVTMAKLEVDSAQQDLAAAEAQLARDEALLATSLEEVQEAERRVQSVESLINDRENDFQTHRTHTNVIQDQITESEGVIADLDEKIRALLAEREQADKQYQDLLGQMDEERAAGSRIQTELENLEESAQSARDTLEDCRGQVTEIQGTRAADELAISRAHAELERRRQSMVEIENTISLVLGKVPVPETTEEGMLF